MPGTHPLSLPACQMLDLRSCSFPMAALPCLAGLPELEEVQISLRTSPCAQVGGGGRQGAGGRGQGAGGRGRRQGAGAGLAGSCGCVARQA